MARYGWTRFAQLAAEQGDRIALIQGAQQLTYSRLREAALMLAAEMELAPGETVILNAPNCPAFAAALLAVWVRGGIACFLHPDSPATHRNHALAITGAKLVFHAGGDEVAGGVVFRQCALAGEANVKVPSDLWDDAPYDAALPASIVFTSGSTGLPKGVTQSGGNLVDGAQRVYRNIGLTADDRLLCPIPFTFDYGWGQLLFCLACGVPLILPEPANAFGLCAAIAAHRPSVIAIVPSLAGDLLSGLAPIRETDVASVRLLTSTGSKMPVALSTSLAEVFPGAALCLNYGLTETYRSASLDPALVAVKPTSVGRAIEGVDLRILDAAGRQAGVGEQGEIIHRGAGVFLGYWRDPEATAAVLRPDPFDEGAQLVMFTGDTGHFDEDGDLFVTGRRDAQMKSMGVRVSPDEIEQMLLSRDFLKEAAVISRPHDQVGDLVIAVIAFRDGVVADAELKTLKRFCNANMSTYMRPREFVVLDSLPKNRNGKVDYPTLRSWHG